MYCKQSKVEYNLTFLKQTCCTYFWSVPKSIATGRNSPIINNVVICICNPKYSGSLQHHPIDRFCSVYEMACFRLPFLICIFTCIDCDQITRKVIDFMLMIDLICVIMQIVMQFNLNGLMRLYLICI